MRHLLAFGLLSLISCSSSSSGSSPAGPGGDASDDAAPNNTMVCGNGTISGNARATDPKSLGPVAGAAYSAPGCTSVVADARGYFNIKTDPTFLIKLDGNASGYANWYAIPS